MLWRRIEQPLTWLVGLVFLSHEVFVNNGERPYLLAAITGVMGVRAMHRRDQAAERRRRDDKGRRR